MPRLAQETTVTTRAEVALKPSLLKTIKLKLADIRMLKMERAALDAKLSKAKEELETAFADADAYELLNEGVRVTMPFGEVPLKMIKGKTAPRLNLKKLMTKFKLAPKQLDSCYDPGKDKKPYLGIYLPGEDEATDGE